MTKWTLAKYLPPSIQTDLSLLQWMRHRNAAWPIKHKVMQAIAEREAPRRLGGLVQFDDACLGGERNGCKTNLKRATHGCQHTVKQGKHARPYSAAAWYHFDCRFHSAAMLPRLVYAAMLCDH